MAETGCTGGKLVTDYCHRNVSFAYTTNRKDLIPDKEFRIRGRNRFAITCAYCKKPCARYAEFVQFCGSCEWYYFGNPDSRCCPECEDVF